MPTATGASPGTWAVEPLPWTVLSELDGVPARQKDAMLIGGRGVYEAI